MLKKYFVDERTFNAFHSTTKIIDLEMISEPFGLF